MPDPKYYISEIVKSGDQMRIRLLPDDGSGVELELDPLNLLDTVPPVENPPVISNFDVSPLSGDAPLDVVLNATVAGDQLGHTFDWGDGSEVEVDGLLRPNIPHTYLVAGTYTATLTVMWEGDDVVETAEIVVSVPIP